MTGRLIVLQHVMMRRRLSPQVVNKTIHIIRVHVRAALHAYTGTCTIHVRAVTVVHIHVQTAILL